MLQIEMNGIKLRIKGDNCPSDIVQRIYLSGAAETSKRHRLDISKDGKLSGFMKFSSNQEAIESKKKLEKISW